MVSKRNRIVAVLCIAAMLLALFAVQHGERTAYAEPSDNETTLHPAADTYIRGADYENTNFGASTALEVRNQGFSLSNRLAYLKFDYSHVSGGIEEATLRLYAHTIGQDETRTVSVYSSADKSWAESAMTWNNAPTHSTTLDGNPDFAHAGDFVVTNPTPGSVYRDHEHDNVGFWYEVDVTEAVQSQPDGIVSFVLLIKAVAETNHVNFNSREHSGAKPELVIRTSDSGPGDPGDPGEPGGPYAPVVYTPDEDTYVAGLNNASPNPFHQETKLEVRHHATGDNIRRSYLKFNFADFDKDLDKAALRLFATKIGATATRTIEIGGVTNAWSASTLTWSGAPSAKNSSVTIAELEIANPNNGTEWTGGQWFEIDVTDYVKDRIHDQEVSFVVWIRDTSPNGTAPNNQVHFNSSEAPDGKPQLVLKPRGEIHEAEQLPKTVSEDVYEVNETDASASGGMVNIVRMNGEGDFIEYALDVPEAGVYAVKVNNKTGADRGIYQLNINGAAQGQPYDQYSASEAYVEEDFGLVHFDSAGAKMFKFVIVGRNTESAGYDLGIDYIRLARPQLEQVAEVTANPPAGTLEEPADVVLTTSTAGAAIYYRIDADPDWVLYTGPIHVDRQMKITAKAVKPPFMLDSDPVEFHYRFPVDTDVLIKRTAAPITLDGVVDIESAEWAGADLIKLEGTTDANGVRTADVYMKYDYEMLYIGANIKDPTPMVNAHTGTGIWNGDALEIFIGDEDLDSVEHDPNVMAPSDRQIVFSAGIVHGYQSYLHVNGATSFPVMLMHIKQDADGKGYTMEAAIPLETLGFLKPWRDGGTPTTMNVVLSDGGFGGRGHWGWTTDGEQTKKSRGLWGKATFEAAPDPADEIEVTTDADPETRVVTLSGRTLHVQNKYVAMLVRDPSGNVAAFEQVTSDGDGNFTFHYQIKENDADGVYTVLIGGEDIAVPKETSFTLAPGGEEPEPEYGLNVDPVQFTDYSGNAVTELTGSGFILANVRVTNESDEPAQASLIVALYDENHVLRRINTIEKTIASGETVTMKAGFDLPANTADSRVKVFVWDSLEGMLPLSDVQVFPN